jgi:SOS-response transcriptional repressor LexA
MLSQKQIQFDESTQYVTIKDDAGEGTFCLIVTDDSMAPEINQGDRLVCDPSAEVKPGAYVVAKLTSDVAVTVRRYRLKGYDDNSEPIVDLVPTNPDYPTRTIGPGSPGKIFARVIEHRRDL